MSRAAGRSLAKVSAKAPRSSKRPRTHRFGGALTTLPVLAESEDVGGFVERLDEAFVARLVEAGALENTLLMAIDGLSFWADVLEVHAGLAGGPESGLPPIAAADAERLFEGIGHAKELQQLMGKLGLARPSSRKRKRKTKDDG
jgi:hypothetical protein